MNGQKRYSRESGLEVWELNGRHHRTDGPALIYDDGTKQWWQNGQRHREDGPAIVYAGGTQEWWSRDFLHRMDGPAIIHDDGTKEWWQNGERHREDGPAITFLDGRAGWYLNGKLHRTDGPAIVENGGIFVWYVNGFLVDLEDCDIIQMEREKTKRHDFVLTPDDVDNINFAAAEPSDYQLFVYLKDNVDLIMMRHPNRYVAAVPAWHLPIDDNYLAVALTRPFVRQIMQYRDDVPDDMRILLEVAS